MRLMQHSDEAVSQIAPPDSQKDAVGFDPLSACSQTTSTSDVCDSLVLPGSTVDDTDSAACQTTTESSCVMLSSSDVLCYASVDEATNVDEHIVEFLLSLFWVLESKRLDRSCEHADNLTLLTAPFEQRKDSSIADFDGRYISILHYSGYRGLMVRDQSTVVTNVFV